MAGRRVSGLRPVAAGGQGPARAGAGAVSRALACGVARVAAPAAAASLLAVQAPAQAQMRIEPTFSASLTLTDNRDLGSTNRKADAILQFGPGLNLRSANGPLQGNLSVVFNETLYARDSSRNTLQTSLAGVFRLEGVPRQAWIDGSASVSRQSISAFGLQSSSPTQVNANTSQVTTLMLAPTLAGRIAGLVDAQARVAWTTSSSSGTSVGDTDSVAGTLSLGRQLGLLGIGLNVGHLVSGPRGAPKTTQDTAVGTASFVPDPELRLSLRRGWEKDKFGSTLDTSSSFWGYGVDWFPTVRTSLSLQADRRFFGNSHAFTLTHRLPRSVWSYTDSRALSGGDLLNTDARSLLDRYQQAYGECMLAFGQNPQATPLCEALARASVGLDPTGKGGFLNSAQSIQRSQVFSVALSGVRTTLTLAATRTLSQQLQGVSYASGDLSLVGRVRQYGVTASVGHRLTPTATLTLTAGDQKTSDSGPLAGNDLRTFTAAVSETLTQGVTGMLLVRHSRFASRSNPYTESAIVGSIGMTF
ncbi:MAG TPA: TIGR03016 family PEP-CTERM system-associated outer membrane protein [Rubrivivax sp.]|nr:TIGR03016 family PEP-CTERM system-associated outer membrane protein [Rubrivivax sp.]